MKQLDEYGRGRLSVLNELEKYLISKINKAAVEKLKINALCVLKDTHKRAHLSGVIQTLISVAQFIEKKKGNLK